VGISAVIGWGLRSVAAQHLTSSFGILLSAGLLAATMHTFLVLFFLADIREDLLPSIRRRFKRA
jgi:hypothetical protein